MKQKIFIISLPSYIDQTTIQRIMRDVLNINNFIQHFCTLCCFAPFGNGITATFFVKDGADLGLYCLVEINPSKITQDDKDKLSSFGTQDNPADWKTAFVELVIAECRKLCEIIYPSRLFRKISRLCPDLLEDTYNRHPSLKEQEQENDPTDPTPFAVYECAYQALKESFYRNKECIETLLLIRTQGNSMIDPKWATVAQEERVALIIFFLFVRPGDELFLRSEARNNARNKAKNSASECDGEACVDDAKATLEASLSNFSKALLAWL